MKKSPLALVNENHGSKEKLVEALVSLPDGVLDRPEDKGAWKEQLQKAANSKLLKLFETGSAVAKRFGNKEKLVDTLLDFQRRGKDADFRAKLLVLPVGKLYDRLQTTERAVRREKTRKS